MSRNLWSNESWCKSLLQTCAPFGRDITFLRGSAQILLSYESVHINCLLAFSTSAANMYQNIFFLHVLTFLRNKKNVFLWGNTQSVLVFLFLVSKTFSYSDIVQCLFCMVLTSKFRTPPSGPFLCKVTYKVFQCILISNQLEFYWISP